MVSKKTRSSPVNKSSTVAEQPLFHQVFGAARSEGRPPDLLVVVQCFAQPGHRSIQVMELQVVTAGNLIVPPPLVGGTVAAGSEQAMQHGQKDGPLHGELEVASGEQAVENLAAAGLLPESLEEQSGADVPGGDDEASRPSAWADSRSRVWEKRAPERSKASSWPSWRS